MKKIIAFFVLAFLVGCAKGNLYLEEDADQESTLSLREICQRDGNAFMTMGPVRDGVTTGGPACPGCMVGSSHICDKTEYLKITRG